MGASNETHGLTPGHYFAALKLIEQLNKDGLLPGYILRNILNEHKDSVDLSKFSITEDPGKEVAV